MPTGGVRQLRGVSRGHAALRRGHGRGGFAVGVEGGGGHATAGSTGPDGVDTKRGAVDRQQGNVRQSPRCWSDYRDDEMTRWRISHGKRWLKLEQVRSEQNLWLVKKVEDDLNLEELVGLLLVYVDDFMPLGMEGVPQALVEKIKGTWESSEESWFGKEPVRFCGVICDGAGDHLGPDGLHQGDHRSEQCHWQVGDPHEKGVQRARGRDRDHGGGDSDGSAPGGRVDLAGHPE